MTENTQETAKAVQLWQLAIKISTTGKSKKRDALSEPLSLTKGKTTWICR